MRCALDSLTDDGRLEGYCTFLVLLGVAETNEMQSVAQEGGTGSRRLHLIHYRVL